MVCNGACWVRCGATRVAASNAAAACVAWGGYLGEVNVEQDQPCAANLTRAEAAWIGLVQDPAATSPAMGWSWNAMRPVTVARWEAGVPDDNRDGENGSEQCAYMQTNGTWDDVECSRLLAFLCRRPAP